MIKLNGGAITVERMTNPNEATTDSTLLDALQNFYATGPHSH